MISEELVASGGMQVREADTPERPPKATAAKEPRVGVEPCGYQGSKGLFWPFLPRDTGEKGWGAGVPEMSPRRPLMPGLFTLTLGQPLLSTPTMEGGAVPPVMPRKQALGRWARGPQALSLAPTPPPQARPVAKKRPDDFSVNRSPKKRACTSSAREEGSPLGSDGSQVSKQGGREPAGREHRLGQL